MLDFEEDQRGGVVRIKSIITRCAIRGRTSEALNSDNERLSPPGARPPQYVEVAWRALSTKTGRSLSNVAAAAISLWLKEVPEELWNGKNLRHNTCVDEGCGNVSGGTIAITSLSRDLNIRLRQRCMRERRSVSNAITEALKIYVFRNNKGKGNHMSSVSMDNNDFELPDWMYDAEESSLPWVERTVVVTPELAKIILGSLNSLNRHPRLSRVKNYTKLMKSGKFEMTPQNSVLVFDTNGILIDGQHRLMAMRDSNTTMSMRVYFNVDPTLRPKFDTGTSRNGADVIGMEEGVRDSRRWTAIAIIVAGLTNKALNWLETNESKLEEFRKHRAAIEWSYQHLFVRAARAAKPQAAVLGTFAWFYENAHPEYQVRLEHLAEKVCTGANIDLNSPAWFIRNIIQEGRGKAGGAKSIEGWSMAARVAVLVMHELNGNQALMKAPPLPRAKEEESTSEVLLREFAKVEAFIVKNNRRFRLVDNRK